MGTDDIIKTYANTVKESILDEEKLVTYITLSKDLCIHINNAKKLLQYVVENIQKEKANIKLNVNYIVSGLLGDNKAQTKVCSNEELNIVKKSYKIVFYDHIYSVCKGSTGVDIAAHILLTKFDDFNICLGKIKSSECIKRSTTEIGNLKTSSQEQKIESKPLITPAKKNKPIINDSKLKTTEQSKNGNGLEETKSIPVKTEIVTPIKEPIASKQATNNTNGHKPQKGIAGFFNKPSVANSKKVDIKKEIKAANSFKEIITDKDQPMEIDKKPEVLDEKDVKKELKSKSNNEILNKIKKSSKVDKKRKRVLHVSDSDSDTENDPFVDKMNSNLDSIDHSEDEIPPTPCASIVKITSGIVNPKKKRKIVDKTYTDDDGYILTRKEEVYESCSENEEDEKGNNSMVKEEKLNNSEVKEEKLNNSKIKEEKTDVSPIKKNSPKRTKKKISPPQKGKQSTLTNFFKKV